MVLGPQAHNVYNSSAFHKRGEVVILSNKKILNRLENGEVFKNETWDPTSVKEASYALRVASDGLIMIRS